MVAARARPANDRSTLYEEITSKIIAELVAGRLPWVQPWDSSGVRAPLGMPKNAATGRAYSGINVLILWAAVVEQGVCTHSWLTFKQALALGGHVRRGERGTSVVYADRFIPDDVRDRAHERGEEPRARSRYPSAARYRGAHRALETKRPPVPPGYDGNRTYSPTPRLRDVATQSVPSEQPGIQTST
jgi:antirestriction protein ArdC